MAKKFFGQFLLERGRITRSALLEAVTFQREVNRTLGELALNSGMMTRKQVEFVAAQQRQRDKLFGEIAIEQGFLTTGQIAQLLGVQKNSYIFLGEALVEKGHLASADLAPLLAEYQAEDDGGDPLPVQWWQHRVAREDVASVCVEQMSKLLYRVCGLQSKIGTVRRGGKLEGVPPVASLRLTGDFDLTLLMAFGKSQTMRHEFMAKLMGQVSDDPELFADCCREFLNIVAGSTMTVLRSQGTQFDLHPPQSLESLPSADELLVVPHHCPEGDVILGILGIGFLP